MIQRFEVFISAAVAVFLGCGLAQTAPSQPPPPASLSMAALEADLDRIVPPLLEQHRVPGASVAVLVDRRTVIVRGYGRLRATEDSPPVDEHSVFQVASLSKPVVAYGVHRLAADRNQEFHLDIPLVFYRPPDEPYERGDERLGKITPRMVLSHSSGFPNWRPDDRSDNPKPLEIKFEPGSKFRYSGEGYVYLQRVLEQITGETLEEYLRRAVLDPLEMTDSSFVWHQRFESVHAAPHDKKGRPEGKERPRQAKAAGTLHTTAEDYARFLEAVLGDDPKEGQGEWLTPTSRIDRRLGWSLGWGFETAADGNLFWQWGDDGTFKAFAAGSHPRGVAVVVLTNGARGLRVGRPVVERVLGSDLRFLDFWMLRY